ncbi:UNVERIFIED_CONTAM: PilZ domain-containing protein [Halobacillus marinus]
MNPLHIGIPLSLETENNGGETFKCKIVDVEEAFVCIDYPIHSVTGRPGFFLEGAVFKVSFVDNQQAVYSFEATVVGREKRTIPVILLQLPDKQEWKRVQRRQYVRVPANVDIAVEVDGVPFTTVTHDISGGGVLIVKPSTKIFPSDSPVEMTIVLPMKSGSYHYVRAVGELVREIEGTDQRPERASLEFSDIEEQDRQTIIRYCFEQQMKLRTDKRV